MENLKTFDRNNIIWVVVFGFSGAALGSVATVAVIVVYIWAIISIALKRFDAHHTALSWFFSIAAAAYGAIIISTAFFHGIDDLGLLVKLLIFFAPLFLLPRLHLSLSENLMRALIVASAVGAIIVSCIAFYQTPRIGMRAEGLMGNAGVFASMSLLFGMTGALLMVERNKALKLLGFLALMACVANVFLSGMRGVMIVLPVAFFLIAIFIIWNASKRFAILATIIGLIGIGILSLSMADRIEKRFDALVTEFQQVENPDAKLGSIGQRVLMLKAGWETVTEKPILGYGIGNRMQAVVERIAPEKRSLIKNYSHPHNGFLTAMLDGGVVALTALIILLLTPIMCVLKSDRGDPYWSHKLFCALMLFLTYLGSGMTNILFQHDIMDSVFIGYGCIIVASCRPKIASVKSSNAR